VEGEVDHLGSRSVLALLEGMGSGDAGGEAEGQGECVEEHHVDVL